ncbi:MAG: hypothetical protein ABI591_09710 [Kofleriaceae bacterium]
MSAVPSANELGRRVRAFHVHAVRPVRLMRSHDVVAVGMHGDNPMKESTSTRSLPIFLVNSSWARWKPTDKMTPFRTPEQKLIRARELFRTDTDGAIKLYRDLVRTLPVGDVWATAHIDLASYDFGVGDYESAAQLTRDVLDAGAGRIDKDGLALAGILLCSAMEELERAIDEVLLRRCVEDALLTGHPREAAAGMNVLARCLLVRNESQEARFLMERSVDLYDQSGSITGGPGTLQRLAKLDIKSGKLDDARRHFERALAYLKGFPDGGMFARDLEKKILKQLNDLEAKP